MPCLSGYEASPPPLLGSPPPPPDPAPPPPPALKMVREWEGVGVWPVATAPPWAALKSIDAKPFGAKAQFDRPCHAMKARYGSIADEDGCMPPIMKNPIQVVYDGASVKHALHGHIIQHVDDVLGTVDVSHQLDRSVVHAVRTRPMYGKYVPAVQRITNTIRKSEVHGLTMEAMSVDGEQALQRFISTHWSRSLFSAITVFMSRYVLVRGILKALMANGKDQTKWKAVYTIMYLGNFVVFMYGLLQFVQHVAHTEEAIQHADATWATKQQAVGKLITKLMTDLTAMCCMPSGSNRKRCMPRATWRPEY